MVSVSDCTSLINQFLPEPHAGLLSGIVFGTKAALSQELKQALITTGTLHIVALSGMNITIITALVNNALLRICSRRTAYIWTMVVIVGFILFVGPSPSVVRAGIMGGITILGVITGRQRIPLYIWGLAVAGMLIAKPSWIGELSFQLSALASLGMIIFGSAKRPVKQKRSFLSSLWVFMSDDLHTTLAAQVFTIPLIFFTFHRISLIAPVTNVLIGWTIQIITILGICMVIVGFVWFPLGQICAWISWIFLQYIIMVIMWTSTIPMASVGW